jgi:hypothetical protein
LGWLALLRFLSFSGAERIARRCPGKTQKKKLVSNQTTCSVPKTSQSIAMSIDMLRIASDITCNSQLEKMHATFLTEVSP